MMVYNAVMKVNNKTEDLCRDHAGYVRHHQARYSWAMQYLDLFLCKFKKGNGV